MLWGRFSKNKSKMTISYVARSDRNKFGVLVGRNVGRTQKKGLINGKQKMSKRNGFGIESGLRTSICCAEICKVFFSSLWLDHLNRFEKSVWTEVLRFSSWWRRAHNWIVIYIENDDHSVMHAHHAKHNCLCSDYFLLELGEKAPEFPFFSIGQSKQGVETLPHFALVCPTWHKFCPFGCRRDLDFLTFYA